MLFNDSKTPLISSKTNREDLKHSTYKSFGKKDISSEATLELSDDEDSFTKVTKDTEEYLIKQEERFRRLGVVCQPFFLEPFHQYYLYITHNDPLASKRRRRDPNSPIEWFDSDSFISFPYRYSALPFEKELSVKYLPKRDVESLEEEENDGKITIRLVWEDEEYIELRILKIFTLQSLLNLVLREPIWTRRYQLFVDDHKLNIFEDIWHSLETLEAQNLIYNHCIINIRLSPISVRYTTWLYFLSRGRFFEDK